MNSKTSGGLGDYLGAVYYSANHTSFEGLELPSDGDIHRLANITFKQTHKND